MVAIFAAVCFSLGFFAACGGNNGSGSGDNGGTGGGDNPSGGHSHFFINTVISPTCTEKGYTLHKCACGYEFMDNLTAALGHNLGEWKVTTPATEGKDGEETRGCTRENCDYTETRKIPAQEHTHDYKETVVEPTCTEKGYTLHKCACGDEYKDNEQPALGHSFKSYVSDGNATCTQDGTKTAKCDRCDEKDTVTDEKTALGHNFGEWKEIKPATEEEDGLKERTCARCGETEEQSIPAKTHEHKYVETVIEPICTEKGYTLHKCACGEVYKDNVTEALGHDYSVEWTIDREPTCTLNGIKSHYCNRCGLRTDITEIDKIGHNYVNGFCTMCGAEGIDEATGLEYVLSNDGTYYIVANSGVEYREKFAIPDEYNGLPVKEIGKGAFMSNYFIKEVILSDNIEIVREEAFCYCQLSKITLGAGLKKIEKNAFYGAYTSGGKIVLSSIESWLKMEEVDSCTRAFLFYIEDKPIIEVTIPSTITSIRNEAFYKFRALRKITIPNSVTSIGDSAFYECGSLTSIVLPDSVTSIGYYAFGGCSSLTSITIPDSVTSIGNYAFGGCSSLTSITIPDSVTSIGYYAFGGCSSLTSITIPDSVTSIGDYAFGSCSSLTSVIIPDSVTSIGDYAFYNCYIIDASIPTIACKAISNEKLEEVNITSGGFIDRESFKGCDSLTSITISDSVTSIGAYAFYGCKSLASVIIGNGVTSIEYEAFDGCTSLTSVMIPDSVTSIEYEAFDGCTSLTSVMIPDSVTSIGYSAFRNCSSLNYNIKENVKYLGNEKNPYMVVMGVTDNSLSSYKIDKGARFLHSDAFWYCTSLTSITIPDSVTSIGNDAFRYCSSLTNIVIPDSVTIIGGDAFQNCGSLTSINIPDSVVIIGGGAFSGCGLLTSITIGNGVKEIGYYAFQNCGSLTSIIIPDNVTYIGDEAFSGCGSLTSITIGNGVTSIGRYAFQDCCNLTDITFNGTTEEWHNVVIIGNETNVSSLTVHCTDGDLIYTFSTNRRQSPPVCGLNGTL